MNACKALVCGSLGGLSGLRVAEVPAPVAGPGEAVVEVAFAALNVFDTLIIRGECQTRPEPPFSTCGEFSGRVVALGKAPLRLGG